MDGHLGCVRERLQTDVAGEGIEAAMVFQIMLLSVGMVVRIYRDFRLFLSRRVSLGPTPMPFLMLVQMLLHSERHRTHDARERFFRLHARHFAW